MKPKIKCDMFCRNIHYIHVMKMPKVAPSYCIFTVHLFTHYCSLNYEIMSYECVTHYSFRRQHCKPDHICGGGILQGDVAMDGWFNLMAIPKFARLWIFFQIEQSGLIFDFKLKVFFEVCESSRFVFHLKFLHFSFIFLSLFWV